MAELTLTIILAVIIGTLLAIIYSLRILFLMERRIANVESHIQTITKKILKEELKIEKKTAKKKR